LLGAWSDASNAKYILDIGTGTGVIALMMAQKNPEAQIHAIDIDKDAFLQAQENFEHYVAEKGTNFCAPTAFHTALQNFEPPVKYNVIISNPPYFIDDQKTTNHQKNVAKHSLALNYNDLVVGINRLLAKDGKAFIVLPAFNLALLEAQAELQSLFVTRLTEVSAVEGKPAYLALVQFEGRKKVYSKTSITIQTDKGDFTEEYKALTRDFYLKF
jgi:tRNA1Val (adenine37-N6)-methyltransferase